MARKATKPAYERKNPHAAEEWAKRKHAANAARPKQKTFLDEGNNPIFLRIREAQ